MFSKIIFINFNVFIINSYLIVKIHVKCLRYLTILLKIKLKSKLGVTKIVSIDSTLYINYILYKGNNKFISYFSKLL